MAKKNPKGPSLYDLSMWAKAGIDPDTGLPNRMGLPSMLKSKIKIGLRVKDEQDAINRYTCYNIPLNLSSQEVERFLYYRHSLIFFYYKELEQFYLMPYAFDEGLDFYGRPIYVHPVPFAAGEDPEKDSAAVKAQREILRSKKLKVIYDVQLEEDFYDENGNFDEAKAKKLVNDSCVIIHDYTPQYSDTYIARCDLQDNILDVMSDCIPFARTALLNSTGVMGLGTNSQDEDSAVFEFSDALTDAALNGKKFVPIRKSSGLDLQELTGGNIARSEEFLQAMQGINNYRLSLYGLDNNGLYDKKAYVNNMQSGVSNVGLSLQDGLTQRQHACNIINSIWGVMMWWDISETVSGMDKNADGMTYENQEQGGQTNDVPTNTTEVD